MIPYGQINRIDPLLTTVETVSERLAGKEREIALLAIEQKLAEIESDLNKVNADASLRNKALYPLQQLKASIAGLVSIPKIRYLAEQADLHLDSAMDAIAASQKQTPPGIKEPAPGVQTPGSSATPVAVPVQKPVKVIRAQSLSTKSYLETEAEVDTYLAKLRQELLTALQEGKRARIQ